MYDTFVRLGGWLFKYRTSLPLPIAAALLLIPAQDLPPAVFLIGAALVAWGERLRLESVRHIGAISRTRSDRLGPLVSSGPFAWVRNPLYLGNIMLWVGFALSAGLAWLAPVIAALLFAAYHAVVLWEEQLLAARLGDAYREYAARVPRWIPRPAPSSSPRPAFSWREALFSERGTLMAIAGGYLLLYLKLKT